MFAVPYSRYIIGSLPWYSTLIVTAICAALMIAFREEKRLGLPKDTTVDLAIWVIPFGIVGARLYYVAFTWDRFSTDLLAIFRIWEGGLAIYGGIIGGIIGGVIFAKRRKLPVTKLFDLVAPGLPLAQAIGRWGNYFNMEAYGDQITNPAWQFFPVAVLIGENWHMATFFYESMWNLLVFVLLMSTRRRMHRSGDVILWYASLYGAGRFVIEGLRTDSLMLGSLRVSQLLSLALCIAVFLLFAVRAVLERKGHVTVAATIIALAIAFGPVGAMLLLGTGGSAITLLPPACLLIASLYVYVQTKPSVQEDAKCPQHP